MEVFQAISGSSSVYASDGKSRYSPLDLLGLCRNQDSRVYFWKNLAIQFFKVLTTLEGNCFHHNVLYLTQTFCSLWSDFVWHYDEDQTKSADKPVCTLKSRAFIVFLRHSDKDWFPENNGLCCCAQSVLRNK